jgi:L-proline amide hydrolase
MTLPVHEGYADFDGHQTWYQVVGDLDAARSGRGPAPLVTLHGGPGATSDYLLSMTDLAGAGQDEAGHDEASRTEAGRAVVFYDQTGNGNSAHLPDRGADYYTVDLFARELTSLIDHLGISARYHVLGQSWGGMLAQEHAITRPAGLASVVLSNTAASFAAFAVEANRLRADLPPEVEATLRRHEEAGTTDNPEYGEACDVFYRRHVCRLEEWPTEVLRSFELIDTDPTVYHTTNGPSEFHVIGSFKDWSALRRLDRIAVPALVISGRYDEAAPALQDELVAGITGAEQVILEESSHMPFWEERPAYMAAVGDFLRRHD